MFCSFFVLSCSISDNVVSNNFIQKRKYNKGFHKNLRSSETSHKTSHIQAKSNSIEILSKQNENKEVKPVHLMSNNKIENNLFTNQQKVIKSKTHKFDSTFTASNNNSILSIKPIQFLNNNLIFSNQKKSTKNKAKTYAILSFCTAIISIPLFVYLVPGILSIIFAVISLNHYKTKENKKGKVFAILGLSIGLLGLILGIPILVFILTFSW